MPTFKVFSAFARTKGSNDQYVATQLTARTLANAKTAFAALYDVDGPVKLSPNARNSHQMSVESAHPELFN